ARRGRAVRPLHRDHGRRDDDPDLAPVLDGASRRSDRGGRRRRDRGAGLPRRARRTRRPLRRAVQAAGGEVRARRRRRLERSRGVSRWVEFVRYLVGVSLRVDRQRTYVVVGLMLVTAVSVPLFALGTKAFVNAAAAGDATRAMWFGALVGALW